MELQLYYFVWTENLVFKNPTSFKWSYVKAVSGGGRGQRTGSTAYAHGINQSRLFASLSEREKHVGAHRGGPIPKGLYKVDAPRSHNFAASDETPRMVRACKLNPTGQAQYGRDNFFIHGQGEQGSDGCIVPLYGQVHMIFDLVSRNKGGWLVVETTERQGVDYDGHRPGRAAHLT
jgi:hypothetical protein